MLGCELAACTTHSKPRTSASASRHSSRAGSISSGWGGCDGATSRAFGKIFSRDGHLFGRQKRDKSNSFCSQHLDFMADQPRSNWALGNRCFHGVFEALPLHSEASKRCRWGEPYAVGTVPPSMTYSVPVMEAARGEARNATRSATSCGFAGRPSGMPPSEFITILRPPS
jgi:hypothetical protein